MPQILNMYDVVAQDTCERAKALQFCPKHSVLILGPASLEDALTLASERFNCEPDLRDSLHTLAPFRAAVRNAIRMAQPTCHVCDAINAP